MADTYTCADCGITFEDSAMYLQHRGDRHGDDITSGIPVPQGDLTMSQQAEDPDEAIVANGQVADQPAEQEHADPAQREVHRSPTP